MDQIVEEFGSPGLAGQLQKDAARQLRDYLAEHPDQRVVTMTGDRTHLIVVLEPKVRTASFICPLEPQP